MRRALPCAGGALGLLWRSEADEPRLGRRSRASGGAGAADMVVTVGLSMAVAATSDVGEVCRRSQARIRQKQSLDRRETVMIRPDSIMRTGADYPRLGGLLASAFAVAAITLGASGPAGAQSDELQPVVIRLVADHPPPPHPAALAQAHFQKRLPEVIPGSELRVY